MAGPREPEQARLARAWIIWAGAFVWWTLHGLVGALNAHHASAIKGAALGWAYLALNFGVATFPWVPITVATFWLSRRVPIEARRWPRAVVIHCAAGAAVVLVRGLYIYLLNPWIGWYPRQPRLDTVLLHSMNNLFFYWMIVAGAHALHYARRIRERDLAASRMEARLARAELDALRAQLQPHFLFNALSVLAELVHRDPDAAERGLVQLGGLLRRILENAEPEVSLEEEMAFVSHYLEIEQLRFGERLRVAWDIPPPLRGARVPHLLLQPLVENAIRHGLAPRPGPGRLRLAARAEADQLVLEVDDDGVGLGGGAGERSGGLGLSHTRDRLLRLYGDRHRLALGPLAGGGTRAEVRLPLRPDAEARS